ncbi:hypothetical protein [Chitinophaga sp. Cy-1792]|uniref:hypothetical protein n=1 Tax=Chitinophaga sp. Cy-1792 TaxID=2608339 RepID=UPI00142014B0|nr:hypothetical protein [Chitinophaga sp. Cy-1792]NIG55697.1 hypothetical protein [Chitinophaga sp. Cy-1792]
MKNRTSIVPAYVVVLTFSILTACGSQQQQESKQQLPGTSLPAQSDSVTPRDKSMADTSGDEQQFRIVLQALQRAVKTNNRDTIRQYLRFPLQTAMQWTNDDVKAGTVDKPGGLVSAADFNKYYNSIFHPDVGRLLPEAGEDNLQEIDADSPEDYYKTLRRVTDKHSHLYEVYQQYPEKNTQAESFFGFVFGRVDGEYKVIAYYGKWPVKD